MTHLIKLTEILKVEHAAPESGIISGGATPQLNTVEKPTLVNPEGIVHVNTTEVNAASAIVGAENSRIVSFIRVTTGNGIYVKETLDEIRALVRACYVETKLVPLPTPDRVA